MSFSITFTAQSFQIVAMAIICYLCCCAYFTVFRLKIYQYYHLDPNRHTDGNSLLFSAMYVFRDLFGLIVVICKSICKSVDIPCSLLLRRKVEKRKQTNFWQCSLLEQIINVYDKRWLFLLLYFPKSIHCHLLWRFQQKMCLSRNIISEVIYIIYL